MVCGGIKLGFESKVPDPSKDSFVPNSEDTSRISVKIDVNILYVLFSVLFTIVQNLHIVKFIVRFKCQRNDLLRISTFSQQFLGSFSPNFSLSIFMNWSGRSTCAMTSFHLLSRSRRRPRFRLLSPR